MIFFGNNALIRLFQKKVALIRLFAKVALIRLYKDLPALFGLNSHSEYKAIKGTFLSLARQPPLCTFRHDQVL